MKTIATFHLRARFLLCLVLLLTVAAQSCQGRPAAARGSAGTIAYVRADTRDEIRLIEPDGSNDRLLWGHGQPDPDGSAAIFSLQWRPDNTEIAFAGSHEWRCSIHNGDAYVVSATGSGYRRLTQAPACSALASYPQAVVRVPVLNVSYSQTFDGYVYYQGAPAMQRVTLPPRGTTTLTFSGVADLGQGTLQIASTMVGWDRGVHTETALDIQGGTTQTTDLMALYVPLGHWEVRAPTWRSDGSRLGFAWNINSLYTLEPHPAPLDTGTPITDVPQENRPSFINNLAWGPAARANQLLYSAELFDFDEGTTEGIYLVTEGSTTVGTRLLAFAPWENILGLVWLPDGSGFVYARVETDEYYETSSANLFLYQFATGDVTRLTGFTHEFAGMPALSPDGGRIAFERGTLLDEYEWAVVDPDVWLMNLDGSEQHLLVQNAADPAWSSGTPAPPPTATPTAPAPTATPTPPAGPPARRLYLPIIRGS